MKPEFFLASSAVFSREEFVSAMRGRGLADATVDSHLTRWRRQGRIVRVKPGVFLRAEVPGHMQPANPDYLALASRMAPDAVLAYHTALEAHGMAQSAFERFTFLTWTKARPTTVLGHRFVPVRSRPGWPAIPVGPARGATLAR
jgi:predicted transcriptional regulator of viral defense system